MLPKDILGYERSIYWPKQAREIAKENGECCSCWDQYYPSFSMSIDGTYQVAVRCFFQKESCKTSFVATNLEMSKRYRRFYNMPED